LPKASIHKISTLVDKGVIAEKEEPQVFSNSKNLPNASLFADGKISRGFEDVRRVFLTGYEDAEKTFHAAHHLYVVVRPASWIFGERK
jgi:hypothetical protein